MGTPKNDGLTKDQRYRLKDVDAYRKNKREYACTPEERAKRTAYMRIWREKNRARHNRLCLESHHRNKHKHIQKHRERHLKLQYGMTQEDFDNLSKEQYGACWICGNVPKERRLFHVDHNHRTGKVRGLLCCRCNGSLGWYEKHFKKVAEYLSKDQ